MANLCCGGFRRNMHARHIGEASGGRTTKGEHGPGGGDEPSACAPRCGRVCRNVPAARVPWEALLLPSHKRAFVRRITAERFVPSWCTTQLCVTNGDHQTRGRTSASTPPASLDRTHLCDVHRRPACGGPALVRAGAPRPRGGQPLSVLGWSVGRRCWALPGGNDRRCRCSG